jgi:hypothetical protein
MAELRIKNESLVLVGKGTNIPLHVLSEGGISEHELMMDVVDGHLTVNDREEADDIELKSLVFSPSFLSYTVSRENIINYLNFYNSRSVKINFGTILTELKEVRQDNAALFDMLKVLSHEVLNVRKALNKKSFVTINEVAEIFPHHKLSSIRNIVTKNKHHNTKSGLWTSELRLGEFRVTFRKQENQKQWIADRIDFLAERPKATDYDFNQRMKKRIENRRSN